jgi:hypothetical protein
MKAVAGLVLALSVCAPLPLAAQLPDNEAGSCAPRIESILLGQRLTARISLPGSTRGIDLTLAGEWDPVWASYLRRQFGIAISQGDRAKVTKIRTTAGLVEIHLNGGGWGNAVDAHLHPRNRQTPSGGVSADSRDPFEMVNLNFPTPAKTPGGSRINLRLTHPVSCDDLAGAGRLRGLLAPLVDVPGPKR